MPDAAGYDFSYVVTRTHLIYSIGRPGLIQGVLTSMRSQNSGFWQQDETQGMVDRVGRRDAVSRSYTDFGQVIVALLETISGASVLSGNANALDPSGMPSSLDLPWHMLTETYEASDGIFSEMLLIRKEGAQ